MSGQLPITALVDLAFLARVATEKKPLDQDTKGKKVMKVLKSALKGYVKGGA